MLEPHFSERPPRANARRAVLCADTKFAFVSPAQASALARLIQVQLDAYAEATGGPVRLVSEPPLTGCELDLLEPLVPRFRALSAR